MFCCCFFASCKTATIWKQVFLSLSSSALFDLFIQKLKIDPKNHKKTFDGVKVGGRDHGRKARPELTRDLFRDKSPQTIEA